MKEQAIKIFEDYVKQYNLSNHKSNWKYQHSYLVANQMLTMATKLHFNEQEIVLSYIIGLFHDIGRFPQIAQYDSYSDVKTIDHGDAGYNLLQKTKLLDNILSVDDLNILKVCVKEHNKYQITSNDPKILKYVKLIRDADKIEILRSIASGFIDRHTTKDAINPQVLKTFYAEKQIPRELITNPNDTIVDNFSFVYDLNYLLSKEIIYQEKLFTKMYQNILNNEIFTDVHNYTINYLKEGLSYVRN